MSSIIGKEWPPSAALPTTVNTNIILLLQVIDNRRDGKMEPEGRLNSHWNSGSQMVLEGTGEDRAYDTM